LTIKFTQRSKSSS